MTSTLRAIYWTSRNDNATVNTEMNRALNRKRMRDLDIEEGRIDIGARTNSARIKKASLTSRAKLDPQIFDQTLKRMAIRRVS